jgi:hypothetical protein
VPDNIYIPDGGLGLKLETIRYYGLATLSLRLFQNNKVPAAADTTADYVECNFSGYVRHTLADLAPTTVSGGVAQTATGVHTWSHNGGPVQNLIYGWFAVDADEHLVAVSRNGAGPISLTAAGQSYSVQATFTDQRAP